MLGRVNRPGLCPIRWLRLARPHSLTSIFLTVFGLGARYSVKLLLYPSKLRALPATVRVRLMSMFPLGIAARLTLSLAAVAVLAAAANIIARESVFIIRMDFPPRLSPVTSLRLIAPQPSDVQAAAPAPQPLRRSTSPGRKGIEALARAVDRYERASRLRAENDFSDNDAEYRYASVDLRMRAAPLVQSLATQYLDRGAELVRIADQRRSARSEHSRHSQAIDQRMQQSLDGAWRIFGRVIARQSLIQLRTCLDEIRQHSARIVAGDAIGDDEIKLLATTETTFVANFEAHRSSLEKSYGAEWVRGMREDFDALAALQMSLRELNLRYETAMQSWSRAQSALSVAVTSAIERSDLEELSRIAAPPVAHTEPPVAREIITDSPADSLTQSLFTTRAVPPAAVAPAETRSVMAAVTAVVIAFIAVISIATVRSVLAPVRRMLQATAQMTRGELRVSVVRGGIRELDTLAGAFNEMAAHLAAAQALSRGQQESLEATVLRRTHMLQQLAQQDPLTSLPNRRHLLTLLGAALDRAAVHRRYVGVYFLDIDNFKNFNDSLGHVFGDRLLMSVANRLEEMADGLGFVARLGGDEFTFVYENAASVETIQVAGRDLVKAFHKLVSVDDRELSISVSVGASIFPDHGVNAESLLRAADSALFRAKELGRSQLAVFTPELTESAAHRFTIEQGLRRAIEGAEFELAYQPEINLATAQVGLVEALLRWRLPDGRLARPGEFLAVAEQSGLISEINDWVMRTAVSDASRWHHGGWPDVRVAINISSRQLLDGRFVEQILALLAEYRLPTHCIELELTESMLQTGSATVEALRVLKSHGFGIALDDFGTGYSSLTSLEQLPLSRIKLDRSLVESIDTSTRSAAIARAVIDLCDSLGLQVTAEGIERPQQFVWLATYRSLFLQGFLLSDAVPFAQVLTVKDALVNKVQDLLMSLPVPAHRSGPGMGVQSIVNLQRGVRRL